MLYRVKMEVCLLQSIFKKGFAFRGTCIKGVPEHAFFSYAHKTPDAQYVMLFFEDSVVDGEMHDIMVEYRKED